MPEINLSFSDSLACHLADLKLRSTEAADGLRKIFIYLTALQPQLCRIEISYDGCGDQGQVEDISFYDSDGKRCNVESHSPLPDDICNGRKSNAGHWVTDQGWTADPNPVNVTADTLLSDFGWNLAYGQNPGFEINEGGCGTISIFNPDKEPGQVCVSLCHSERYMQTTDFEYYF